MNVANFAANHCDTFQAFQTCAVVAQAAACFGVFLKSHNKDNKNVALAWFQKVIQSNGEEL